ncbi:MAG: class I SAM-dependent methyltransferase [Nitrospirota bacterium]
MECKICGRISEKTFEATILSKHRISYYHCNYCGYLQTEDPFWLKEAYKESINITDTGIMGRNISLSKTAAAIIFRFFDYKSRFLDYAGGYGTFTRLMRDIGFDFYWHDPFTQNLFARGFEYVPEETNCSFDLLTSFESYEHFADPVNEMEKMLGISRNILFTTILLPNPVPEPEEWWYYGLEHGQHISFYSAKTLDYLSRRFGLNYYSLGWIHLFTEKPLPKAPPPYMINSLFVDLKLRQIKRKLKSRTFDDMLFLKTRTTDG